MKQQLFPRKSHCNWESKPWLKKEQIQIYPRQNPWWGHQITPIPHYIKAPFLLFQIFSLALPSLHLHHSFQTASCSCLPLRSTSLNFLSLASPFARSLLNLLQFLHWCPFTYTRFVSQFVVNQASVSRFLQCMHIRSMPFIALPIFYFLFLFSRKLSKSEKGKEKFVEVGFLSQAFAFRCFLEPDGFFCQKIVVLRLVLLCLKHHLCFCSI